jgi:PKD repeat protein
MRRTLYLHLILFSILSNLANAQSDFAVLMKQGTRVFPENVQTYVASATIQSHETIDGKYYRLLQFYNLPDQAGHAEIARQGIELLEYIPHKTYVASIPTGFDPAKFAQLGVRSIQPIDFSWKMADNLNSRPYPEWAMEDDRVLVMLKYFPNLDQEQVLRLCKANGIRVVRHNGVNNFLRVSVPVEKVQAVVRLPFVAYLELVASPPVPDDNLGRALHRSNIIDTQFPGGRRYTGEGVGVLVRDDGVVGPHIDFQGRIDNSLVDPQIGSHGDGVAGILCGAGNLDPRMRGMAASASLYVLNYESDFLDETMDLFFNKNVIVTNSSYSDGCNDGYTEGTATVDQQLYDNPTLMHVFSAGNSNNQNCGYGAGNQWGNITGGHKMAKNCIASANLFSDATLANSSSRGPAHDGRLKPDIAANGQEQRSTDENNTYQVFGGTSGAAPGIAGILAQLHQAYREKHGGETADAALLKTLLLNTANDLGNKGPDFKYGWGHVNAYRAALALEEERHFKAVVLPGQTNTHSITIPTGVAQARIMVYWMDPPASVMTSKALINDIDISMQDPASTKYLPWVLDPTPDPAKLDLPATNGMDTLNNMEQISIDNPAAGTYVLSVVGKSLPLGIREYYVTWDFRTTGVTVMHPFGGESFEAGDTIRLHWDAESTQQFFVLWISTDGGTTYSPINSAQANERLKDWIVPDTILSGNCKVKVTRGAAKDESDYVFSIAPRPKNVKAEKACPDYVRFTWSKVNVPDTLAPAYELFTLGDKYMEPIATVTDTFYELPTFNLDPSLDYWFAVRLVANGGIASERTIAALHNSGLLECAQTNDVSLIKITSPPGKFYVCEQPVSVLITNPGLMPQSNFNVAYRAGNLPPVVENFPGTIEPGDTVSFSFNTPITSLQTGMHDLYAYIILPADQANFNDTTVNELDVVLYPGGAEPLNYAEDFEGDDFPPPLYFINNPDGLTTWDSWKVIGITGDSSLCARMNNGPYTNGALDDLVIVPVDLTGVQNASLRFDVAYARRSATRQDGLRVEISTDCGTTFPDAVYEKIGTALATVPDQTLGFFPDAANDWRTDKIDLGAYLGKTIVIKFVNICGRGNNLFVDNINVETVAPPAAGFTASETEICAGETVTFTDASTGGSLTYLWNFGAGASPATSTNPGPVTVTFSQGGTNTATLTVNNFAGSSTFETDIVVKPLPVPGFTFTVDGKTVTFTNTTTDGVSYFWDFGDQSGGISANPSHTYSADGVYTVNLMATNDCGSVVFTKEIMVGAVSINDLVKRLSVEVLPNPNKGAFSVNVRSDRQEQLRLELHSVTGVLLEQAAMTFNGGLATHRFEQISLPAGMYFLKIFAEDGEVVRKVLVE